MAKHTAVVTDITHNYHKMNAALAGLAPDVEKAEAGNKAAATRVRKAMTVFGKDAKAYRQLLLEREKSDK